MRFAEHPERFIQLLQAEVVQVKVRTKIAQHPTEERIALEVGALERRETCLLPI